MDSGLDVSTSLKVCIAQSLANVSSAMNNKHLIEANTITNTNWLQQLLWMSDLPNRHFETYMALYSLNSSTLKFKDDPFAATHPGIRHLRVDLIWIWDAFYKEVLTHEGIFCRLQVVGPILWYLPKQIRVRQNLDFLQALYIRCNSCGCTGA